MEFRVHSSMHLVKAIRLGKETNISWLIANSLVFEGATVQILLFATIAIELKRRAPNAHTFLEVIRARYGTIVHVVFIVFCLMTNILVTAMLLTGGSAVMTSLTGVHTAAACFLLPIGVVLYTLFGGIKATFITDYMHTVVILVVIFLFAFSAYATNAELGSPGRVYDALVEAAKRHPVEGNAEGSYVTMRSKEGGIFWIINLIGNFGLVQNIHRFLVSQEYTNIY